MENNKKLLNINDMVEIYGFKPWGIRHRVRMRTIPFIKLNRSIYFDRGDIEKWLEEHKIKARNNTGGY
jgi:predicted DNA-binding transcriptional regulator AlpA